MKQGGLYDGRGLILGHNGPFKNILNLGMICRITFRKKILYKLKQMEIDEIYGNDGLYIVLKKLMKYRKC